MSTLDKLISARASLVLDEPFFGALVLGLRLEADPTCKTAWVDGRTLGYNPAWIDTQAHAQVTAVLAHEVMHCASGHPWRRDARDGKKWNIACDRAINPLLADAGFKLPDGVEMATGDELGKSAEWICNRLPDPAPNGDGDGENKPDDGDQQQDGEPGEDGQGDGDGTPDPMGEVRDAPTDADEDGEAPTEEDWQQATQQAALQAKAQGKLAGGMARFAIEAVKPRVDWKSALRRFIQTYAASDFSWKTPNPRYIASGLYLPALQSQELGEIAIAIDTSGSIDQRCLDAAKGEVEQIMTETQPAKVTIYYADTDIAHKDEFDKGEPLTWNPAGFGGTSFVPVIEAVNQQETAPVCLLYITDMAGTFPESSEVPVLWVTDGRTKAPFGEVVAITD